jgi:hypothetical protein
VGADPYVPHPGNIKSHISHYSLGKYAKKGMYMAEYSTIFNDVQGRNEAELRFGWGVSRRRSGV